jgi:hypothetical protein
MPRLTKQERGDLEKLQGRWPHYAQRIVKLDRDHPRLPPLPLPVGKIVRQEQWLTLLQKSEDERVRQLRKANNDQLFVFGELHKLAKFRDKWPDFAVEAKKLWRTKYSNIVPPPLGASKLEEFPSEAQDYIRKELMPKLSANIQKNLMGLEGRWPEYPNRLLELAKHHGKVIPGMSLPGPPDLWKSVEFGAVMKSK